MQAELPDLDRMAQPRLDLRLAGDFGLHFRAEETQRIAPRGLGPIHGQVGLFQQFVHADGVAAEQGDADADRAVVAMVLLQAVRQQFQVEGPFDGSQYFRGHMLDLASRWRKIAQPLEQDHELVATQAGDAVAAAHAVPQAPADLDQEAVADVVAQGVVERLEVVEIKEHHGPRLAVADAADQGLLDAVGQQAAVEQAGQVVEEGQPFDAVLGLLALGDIDVGGDEMRGRTVFAGDRRNDHPFRVNLAVLAPVPDLALPAALGQQATPHLAVEVVIVPPRLEHPRGIADAFLGRVAGAFGKCRIDPQDDPVGIGYDHRFMRLESGGGNAQLGLDAVALGNVPEAPDPPGNPAVQPARLRIAFEHPAVQELQQVEALLFRLADPLALRKKAQGVRQLPGGGLDQQTVVISCQHLRRNLPHLEVTVVIAFDLAVFADHQDAVGRRIERRHEGGHGFFQALLGLLVFGQFGPQQTILLAHFVRDDLQRALQHAPVNVALFVGLADRIEQWPQRFRQRVAFAAKPVDLPFQKAVHGSVFT